MNELDAIKTEFDKEIYFHKKSDFCHTMDKESYKIKCKTFFSNTSNKNMETALAEEANIFCNESEKEFLLWLILKKMTASVLHSLLPHNPSYGLF